MNAERFAPSLALLLAVAGCSGISPNTTLPAFPNATVRLGRAPACRETVLHSFGGLDGAAASDGLIAGKAGVFYGTTLFGGGSSGGNGTVFKLAPQGSGYAESVLYSFKGGYDGSTPEGIVLRGGVLYGVTFAGGDPSGNGGLGWGTIFELSPGKSGYTESVLYRFRGGLDAWEPLGPIVLDKTGNIYGASAFGGSRNDGAVFKLTPGQSGYTESLLYSFPGGAGGILPEAGVTIDKHGSIYGTTMYGGSYAGFCDGGCGTVYKLALGKSGYSESVIFAFDGLDGDLPYGAVTIDERSGAVFGTTFWGGTKRVGTFFELTPNGSYYTERVLHSFEAKADGFLPEGTPLLEPDGTLYGTAAIGGGGCRGIGCGVVFELTPSGAHYSFHVVYDFRRPNHGAEPEQTNLLSDESGAIYGATRSGGTERNCADGGPGGAKGCGVVFKIAPQ
ncbi:MAG: choice-of-anchor tandem repeat GloVer-containing protein [Candidatus Cybelea sp.]